MLNELLNCLDESWIAQNVRLIPRMKELIASKCPALKLAITEYEWGGDNIITGALAQVEILGIFGREGESAKFHRNITCLLLQVWI
jgi:hypothetical protein